MFIINSERLLKVLEQRCIHIEEEEQRLRGRGYTLSNGAVVEHHDYTGEVVLKGKPEASRYLDIALAIDQAEQKHKLARKRLRSKSTRSNQAYIVDPLILFTAMDEYPFPVTEHGSRGDVLRVMYGSGLALSYNNKTHLVSIVDKLHIGGLELLFQIEKQIVFYSEYLSDDGIKVPDVMRKLKIGDYEFICHDYFRKGYCHVRFKGHSVWSVDMIEQLAKYEDGSSWQFFDFPQIKDDEFVILMNFFEAQLYPRSTSRRFS